MTFERSTKVLYNLSLLTASPKVGAGSEQPHVGKTAVGGVWLYGAMAPPEVVECSTQDASMFKATAREVNHAIKTPKSKPTTRRGLRHHGRLASDSVAASRAAACFR